MKAALQHLFLRAEDLPRLPRNWRPAQVKDISDVLKPGKLYDDKTASEEGDVPVVNQAADGWHGFHNEEPGVMASEELPVSIFANHTCAMRLLRRPFSCIQNIFPRIGKPGICDTVFFHYATFGRVSLSGYKGHHPIYRDVWIPLPPLPKQIEIGRAISAYDDLIENNRRRMALLEDAARQLYREWFVRLRFPGHEHTRITNGVPEGWQRQTLAELCESIDYGYTASAEQDEVGPKFLRITDIVPEVIDWASVPYCPIEEDRLAKFRLVEGDIVIARTGATVGYAKRLNKRHPEAVFASYLVRLRLKSEIDSLMVGVFVESGDYKSYVQSRVGGAAQPNANAKVLSAVEILFPPPIIQRIFHGSVEPLMDQREVIQLQNEQLRAARDLLLPRLMSGEIAV
jgi:type I restriction enzyme S subunit